MCGVVRERADALASARRSGEQNPPGFSEKHWGVGGESELHEVQAGRSWEPGRKRRIRRSGMENSSSAQIQTGEQRLTQRHVCSCILEISRRLFDVQFSTLGSVKLKLVLMKTNACRYRPSKERGSLFELPFLRFLPVHLSGPDLSLQGPV